MLGTSTQSNQPADPANQEPRKDIRPYRMEQNAATGRWEVFGPSGINVYELGFPNPKDAESYALGCIRYDNQ